MNENEIELNSATSAKNDIGEISDGYHTFNELYEHRHALFIALMTSLSTIPADVWFSLKHDDGTMFENMFIAGIRLPSGMVTYHLPIRYIDNLRERKIPELENAPKWDGHTPKDVVERLLLFRG